MNRNYFVRKKYSRAKKFVSIKNKFIWKVKFMKNNFIDKKKYQDAVEKMSPKTNIFLNCFNAFWSGGLICVIGEFITNYFLNLGYELEVARTFCSVILIFFGVILTGFGVYDKIGKFAGAGSIVPITGFANSVAAPALEFKKEGYIFGVGAKMFLISGPVIVYSTLASVIVGIFYYFGL